MRAMLIVALLAVIVSSGCRVESSDGDGDGDGDADGALSTYLEQTEEYITRWCEC